jgi:hypothetical protein
MSGGNENLRGLMAEAGFSASGLARRLQQVAARRGIDVRPSTTQIGRWLAGQQPRDVAVDLVAAVLRDRLGRPVTRAEMGWTTRPPPAEVIDGAASRLWRADATTDSDLRSLPFAPESLDRPILDWTLGNSAVPIPARRDGPCVTDQDVRMVADMLAMFRKLDHAYGAGQLREQVVHYLATEVGRLLSRPAATPTTEAALMTVAAGICEMVGYQAVDVGADGLAQRYYLAALGFAHASGDRAYGAHLVAANIAHLALHVGHPAEALRMVHAARHGTPAGASPATRAAFLAVEARAHARLKDEKAATAALTAAEIALSSSRTADEPAWIGYFTPADLEDETAHCMHDLGLHDQAQRIVRAAVADLDPSRVRRLAIDTALLATSLAESGQVEEACAVGREAVAHAGRTQSVRTKLRINDMRQALSRYTGHCDVAALEELIRETVGQHH